MEQTELGYKWFAQHSFYRNLNAHLLDLAGLRAGQRIVELACGTGAVTRLILEKVRGAARDGVLISIDSSASALAEAMEQLKDIRHAAVQFVQSRVEELTQVVKEKADAIVFCNGIHYIQDKTRLLEEVSKTLRRGGVFAFNTSFYHGAQVDGTEQFYRRWIFRAVRILKVRHPNLPKSKKVESRRQLTSEQYQEILQQHGFVLQRAEVKTVPVYLQGWVDICRYEDFVQGVLPGVPVAEASAALQEAVAQTFQELNLKVVSRNWLTMVVVKPA